MKLKKITNFNIFVQDAKWVNGLSIGDSVNPIVDIGSTKCEEWYYNKSNKSTANINISPSITTLIPEVKLYE